jgi:anti-sigma regulatory factor (Ser/Thr protein kinase)
MKELALHILDIAENSLRAGASVIRISIDEDSDHDLMTIVIEDDGCGMDEQMVASVLDPFFTTKSERRVGFGLPLFKRAAERADGDLTIESVEGSGTKVVARFKLYHIDRQPLGDMSSTITTLLLTDPDINVVYRHSAEGEVYVFDTRTIRQELDGLPISDPHVILMLSKAIRERKSLGEP